MNSTNFFVALYLSLNTFCVSVLNFNVNTKTQSKVWVRIRVGFSPHFCLGGGGADVPDRMERGNYIIL